MLIAKQENWCRNSTHRVLNVVGPKMDEKTGINSYEFKYWLFFIRDTNQRSNSYITSMITNVNIRQTQFAYEYEYQQVHKIFAVFSCLVQLTTKHGHIRLYLHFAPSNVIISLSLASSKMLLQPNFTLQIIHANHSSELFFVDITFSDDTTDYTHIDWIKFINSEWLPFARQIICVRKTLLLTNSSGTQSWKVCVRVVDVHAMPQVRL